MNTNIRGLILSVIYIGAVIFGSTLVEKKGKEVKIGSGHVLEKVKEGRQ